MGPLVATEGRFVQLRFRPCDATLDSVYLAKDTQVFGLGCETDGAQPIAANPKPIMPKKLLTEFALKRRNQKTPIQPAKML
jgi:hypothetical protein